ncbi:hypothetical protein JXC34_00080 [Candidatus Woesearchaeota archaeon]|nr:hypothetical protein [Candidatus Woesearchaeota archaeon]
MIGNKLELDILGIFNRDITAFLSINKISKLLNKAYPHINAKVNQLIKEGILNKTEFGRSYLCSMNISNAKTVALLSLAEAVKKDKFLKKTGLSDILTQIRKEFRIYTIFAVSSSIYFVMDHIHDKEAIKNSFKELESYSPVFLSKDEFMIRIKEEKSLFSKKIILYSPETYFELIEEIYPGILAGAIMKNG